ncbi:MAG TPA: hypothetical protein ENG78_04100 [Acidiferrobacteraceae bacterium]|jgi:hypothetical protein|nr:hypothetical protein [Acidiferrobacteraceae bacterium]HEX19985.1 hypothetical protein [Acidiferrobacteraceae bacterium]
MRIAAGVLLLVTAFFNLFASIGYFGIGIGTLALGEARISQAHNSEARQENNVKKNKRSSNLNQKLKNLPITGIGLLIFSLFLIVTVVLLTIAAIFLFSRKQAIFIMLAAGAGLIAEATGIYLFSLGFSNTIGIIASVLAIIAATQIQRIAKG